MIQILMHQRQHQTILCLDNEVDIKPASVLCNNRKGSSFIFFLFKQGVSILFIGIYFFN
jgi:hypothetical protein